MIRVYRFSSVLVNEFMIWLSILSFLAPEHYLSTNLNPSHLFNSQCMSFMSFFLFILIHCRILTHKLVPSFFHMKICVQCLSHFICPISYHVYHICFVILLIHFYGTTYDVPYALYFSPTHYLSI